MSLDGAPVPPLGQATMANSSPVVLASDQTAVPVSGTVTASGPLTDAQLRASAVAVEIAGTVFVDSEFPAGSALGDGASATPSTTKVGSVPLLMNASTIDRQRAVVAALDSVGTGIAAAGMIGQLDDTATAAVTENQFAPVRISSRRAVLVEGVASGTSLGVNDGGGALTVDNAGTFAVQESGSQVQVDDAAFTPATSKVVMVGAECDDTAPDSVNEGDGGAVRMSANRSLHVRIRDDAGNERGLNVDANGEIGVGAIRSALPAGTNAIGKLAANSGVDIGDVDVTSIVPGTGATNLGKAEDAAHTTGDVGVMSLAVSNEANTARAADGDYLPMATDTEGNIRIVGNRDHDAVDAGEVVGVGMRAIAHGTNPTAVAAADRTAWYANRAGVPFVIGGHPNIQTFRVQYTTAQTNAAIVTVAAGLKIVVTRISVLCSNANTVNPSVIIGFATVTTPTGAGVVLSHPGIAPGSGVVEGNGGGILGVGTDDQDLRITSTLTATFDVVVSYYTIES